MEVISIEEQEDGSALVTLNMTEEENNMLVGFAVNTILKERIEAMEKEKKCFVCDREIDNETLKKFPDTVICSDCMEDGIV